MKLIKIYLILLIQLIELLLNTKSDHVQVISCKEDEKCLQNLDRYLLEIILENSVNTTQPCEHFWDYTCGSWTSAPYYDHVDNFGAMANYYADQLIQLLNNLQEEKSYEEYKVLVKKIKKYYMACRNSGNYYLEMSAYLKELAVTKIFGESFKWIPEFWQNPEIWQDFDWLRSVAYLRKYGFKDIFLQESVGFPWNNSRKYAVELKIPQPVKHFTNKYKVLQIMEEFNLIFVNNYTKNQNYINLSQDIYQFDKDLLELYKKYHNTKQDHYVNLQDLKYLITNIDWDLYFQLLLNRKLLPQTSIEFSGNLIYFQDLQLLLRNTPNHIKGSYVLIRFLQYLMDIRPLITDRECMLHTNAMFPLGVNFIYNKFLYKNRLQDEEIIQTLFLQLKTEFSLNIQENKFSLNSKEQKYLQDKLDLMELRIGNLPLIIHDINHYYQSLKLLKNNFFHNHLEILKFRTLLQHQVFFKPLLGIAKLDSYYVNDDISQLRNAPYFIHQRNMLIIPMVFLQLPFYHYNQNPIFQYSLLAWIMAHELSHAFDTQGLNYDAWGNENLLGLQISHKSSYLSVVECLTKNAPTVSVNERMADVNGLQLAWQTFQRRININIGSDRDLSIIQQLFFRNFAQFFCGSLPHAIAHDRDDVRVRQTVANMREFAEVFECSKDAKENPKDKCNIWRK